MMMMQPEKSHTGIAIETEREIQVEYQFITANGRAVERHRWYPAAVEVVDVPDWPPDYVIDLTAAQRGGLFSGWRFGARPWRLPLSADDLRLSGRATVYAGATMEAEVRIHDCGGGRRVLYRIVDGIFVGSEVIAWTDGMSTESENRLILGMRTLCAAQLLLGEEVADDYAKTSRVGGHLLLLGCLAGLLSPPDLGTAAEEASDVTALMLTGLGSLHTVDGSSAARILQELC